MTNSLSGTDDVLQPSRRVLRDRQGGWWFPLLLLGIVAGMACWGWAERADRHQEADTAESPTPAPEGASVRLQIDFGNGVTKDFAALAWHKGMTVADLMDEARRFRPGIRYQHQNEGSAAFLDAIEGVEPGSGRGWKYRVNGQYGEASFGIHPLQPDDHVLWSIEANQ